MPAALPDHAAPSVDEIAVVWASTYPNASLADAFRAGYELAMRQTMHTPPVTADTLAFAPEGKVNRTIRAALELFRDQVLREADEEIASGEWCSIEEVGALIEDLKEKETP